MSSIRPPMVVPVGTARSWRWCYLDECTGLRAPHSEGRNGKIPKRAWNIWRVACIYLLITCSLTRIRTYT
jgi:hypothetical protein